MMSGAQRALLRFCVLLSIVLALDGCRGRHRGQQEKNSSPVEDLPVMETGIYYRGDIEGEAFLVYFSHSSSKNAKGHYYRQGDAPIAERHSFSVSRKQGSVFRDVDLIPYRDPVFRAVDCSRYREPCSEVSLSEDVIYGHASGYWTSLPGVEDDVMKIFTQGVMRTINKKKDLDLTMDIYVPDDVKGKKPLVLFLHGGAFYVGDKAEPAYQDFCRHFASMGYVTASMNYRMGFHVGKSDIERAGYSAVQDAHAAMRYLVAHAAEYDIDTNLLFVAGSSAGSITALNLAFMREENRPESSRGSGGFLSIEEDMGPIESSGNDIRADFSIKAVGNMWGAVSNLEMLRNSRTDIISFHGDEDAVVPYDQGYPFQAVGKFLSSSLSDPMFGSLSIDNEARALGLRSVMTTFHGLGHALNTDKRTKAPNENHFTIREEMTDFFFLEIVPEPADIFMNREGEYVLDGTSLEYAQWKADGGFVLDESEFAAKVLWKADAPEHKLTATGTQAGGAGFLVTREF